MERQDGLTVILGLKNFHSLINLNDNLHLLHSFLGNVAKHVQIILVINDSIKNIANTLKTHITQHIYVGHVSNLTLAKVASVYAEHLFVLTYMVEDDAWPSAKVLEAVWRERYRADLIVARFVYKQASLAGIQTRFLSRLLSLPLRDIFGSCRLYRREVLFALRACLLQGTGVIDELELLVYIIAEGYSVLEVNLTDHCSASNRLVRLPIHRLIALWRLRNSILSADYDDRAYDSIIPLQRYWQRRRFYLIRELTSGEGPVLDVGCGSSRILTDLPKGSVGIDILLRKLRYARRFSIALIQASGNHLPVADGAFTCVLCSQVIEHLPKHSPIIEELCRVLRPGGRLVIGTPDYAHWEWRLIERLYAIFAPGGYADEHIARYSRQELLDLFESRGFVHEATRYILRSELIMAFRKIKA